MKYPSVWHIDSVIKFAEENSSLVNGKWVPCRSVGYPSFLRRVRLAWMVFTGKADALVWEGQ